jgi:hypothetical protein
MIAILGFLAAYSISAVQSQSAALPPRYLVWIDGIYRHGPKAGSAIPRHIDAFDSVVLRSKAGKFVAQVTVAKFDNTGMALNPVPTYRGWRAAWQNYYLALVDPTGRREDVALAFPGSGAYPDDPESGAASAVCDMSDDYRYTADWPKDDPFGLVGCREWGAQMVDKARQYVDVTTYRGNGYVGKVFGWVELRQNTKPVIAKVDGAWYCFFACPNKQAAGPILDFHDWLRKNKFPEPQIPQQQPEFPDSSFSDAD